MRETDKNHRNSIQQQCYSDGAKHPKKLARDQEILRRGPQDDGEVGVQDDEGVRGYRKKKGEVSREVYSQIVTSSTTISLFEGIYTTSTISSTATSGWDCDCL